MRKVVCINADRLPEGANLIKWEEYLIEREFINELEQKVFIISGINNKGTTKLGMRWHGYRADRFISPDLLDPTSMESEELIKESEF